MPAFLSITPPRMVLLASLSVQKTSMLSPTSFSASPQRGSSTIGAFLTGAYYERPYLLLLFLVVVVVFPMQNCSLLDWPQSSIVLHETETAVALGEMAIGYTVRLHKTQTPLGTMEKSLLSVATS